jgi:hypothetical protein
MQTWLLDKLDHITEEFLGGGGFGTVFEAQYLAYLECLLTARGHPADIWTRLREMRQKSTPPGEPVRSLSYVIEDRQELVDALLAFRAQFEGPSRAKLPSTRGIEAVLDFLGGDDP